MVTRSILEPMREIGLEPQITITQRDAHWQAMRRGDFDFFRDGWIADYPDPENFFYIFYTGAPANNTGYSNPEYDRLFRRLESIPAAAAARPALCAKLEAILRSDVPAIFLYHERSFYLVRDEVHGVDLSINPLERKFYEYVWLDEEAR